MFINDSWAWPDEPVCLPTHEHGGIEANAPLPLIPNLGTSASSSVFAVTLTMAPSSVIPASKATFANPNPHFHRSRGAMMSHGEDD